MVTVHRFIRDVTERQRNTNTLTRKTNQYAAKTSRVADGGENFPAAGNIENVTEETLDLSVLIPLLSSYCLASCNLPIDRNEVVDKEILLDSTQ